MSAPIAVSRLNPDVFSIERMQERLRIAHQEQTGSNQSGNGEDLGHHQRTLHPTAQLHAEAVDHRQHRQRNHDDQALRDVPARQPIR